MLRPFAYNYFYKINESIPTDLPLETVWWYFSAKKVSALKQGSRIKKGIIIFSKPLKKYVFVRTINALETLAYMRNRFLFLNPDIEVYEKKLDETIEYRESVNFAKYRITECKEWIPGQLLRSFQQKHRIETKISGKRFVIRTLLHKFPTVLINLLYTPADIQIAEANNINVITFSFCNPMTKSFIISKLRAPFNHVKQSHFRYLRKIILRKILFKINLILKKRTLWKLEYTLAEICRYNKNFIKKILKKKLLKKKISKKKNVKNKKKLIKKHSKKKSVKEYRNNKFSKSIVKLNTKKQYIHDNKNKKLFKQTKKYYQPNYFSRQNNYKHNNKYNYQNRFKKNNYKNYGEQQKPRKKLKELEVKMASHLQAGKRLPYITKQFAHDIYVDERYDHALEMASVVKINPDTFILGKELK